MIQGLMIVWIFALTFLAGGLNAYGIIQLKYTLTHHTGNITNFAIALATNSGKQYILISILFSYFIGSFLSGILFHDRVFYPAKRYGLALMAASFCLIILANNYHVILQILFISFFTGMQNGMFILYKGALVRTTHITGYLTDGAFYLAAYLRGQKQHAWKARFYLLSLFVFFLGAYFIARLHMQGVKNILNGLGLSYLVAGFYFFYLRNILLQKQK